MEAELKEENSNNDILEYLTMLLFRTEMIQISGKS